MKNLEKREVRSHNKVCALFVENKVRFARVEQLWLTCIAYNSRTNYTATCKIIYRLNHTHTVNRLLARTVISLLLLTRCNCWYS